MMESPRQSCSSNSNSVIALVDYGIGNLRSVQKALEKVCYPDITRVVLTSDPEVILSAAKVVLPGVGAYGDGMAGLRQRNLVVILEEITKRGTPLLGICLGMQLLFENSSELGEHRGLGLIPGCVRRFDMPGYKVPQTGWNQIQEAGGFTRNGSLLLAGLPPNSYAYFNHSYYCVPALAEDWVGITEYGIPYASVVNHGQLYGVQFHPEKSQDVGLQILNNFLEIATAEANGYG
jgi:imidazole glycerol-phosphate synthase subunit HisH